MTVFEVDTSEEFYSYVEDKENKYSQPYVFVDFYAQWCGPCKRIAPYIDELSELYKDNFVFLKVDVDENGVEDLAQQYGVNALPTFMFFKKGEKESPSKSITGANQVEIKNAMDKLTAKNSVNAESKKNSANTEPMV